MFSLLLIDLYFLRTDSITFMNMKRFEYTIKIALILNKVKWKNVSKY